MEDGGWRMEDGGWRMEDGRQKTKIGMNGVTPAGFLWKIGFIKPDKPNFKGGMYATTVKEQLV